MASKPRRRPERVEEIVAHLRKNAARLATPTGGVQIDFHGADIAYKWTEVERERLTDDDQRKLAS